MKEIFIKIEEALKQSANYLPLELSSALGGFIEEVIAPIPSPFVMAAVGSAAFSQGKGILVLLWLSVLGSLGKTAGSWIIYVAADKFEDFVVGKLGRFFGVSHAEVEGLGKYFNRSWKDGLVLLLLRALPIVPSSPVSAVAGVIKIPMKTYLFATFVGNVIRNLVYMYLGYSGISAYESMLHKMESSESVFQIVMFLGVLGLVGWFYYTRQKGHASHWLKGLEKKKDGEPPVPDAGK